MIPILDNFAKDYEELKGSLINNSEISFQTFVEPHLTKTFLFSCASYYESCIQKMIEDYVNNITHDERLMNFIMNKAVKRQYHTYFQWDTKNGDIPKNINSFLGLFGENFKERVAAEIKENEKYTNGMIAFLTIGNLRNHLAHNNFLEYTLPKTFDEIKELNIQAELFLEFLQEKFV